MADVTKPPAAPGEKKDPPAAESKISDRQLQMALDYLKGKLGS
jgi:hypothetical protein